MTVGDLCQIDCKEKRDHRKDYRYKHNGVDRKLRISRRKHLPFKKLFYDYGLYHSTRGKKTELKQKRGNDIDLT